MRRILAGAVIAARIFGLFLIAIAVLGLPMMRPVTGRVGASFELLACIGLGVMGIAWLVGLRWFLHFFDQYLSRN